MYHLTIHNRKLISFSNFYDPTAISVIPKNSDPDWFLIFPYLKIDFLGFLLNSYVLKDYVIKVKYKNLVYVDIINVKFSLRNKKNKKILDSLLFLHKKFDSEMDFINEINNIWIDPNYKIEIFYEIFKIESFQALL